MYEQIDLDAIESNKDEAPDYRPFLKSSSPGAPVNIEYRMRYLSSLESTEKASYDEFARIADREGLKKVAGVFRQILEQEKEHERKLNEGRETMTNLRMSIQREKDKITIMRDMLDEAYREKETKVVSRLKGMISEEEGHVIKLSEAAGELEKKMEQEKDQLKKEAAEKEAESGQYCNLGVCVTNGKGELADDTAPEVVE
ncbi:MAG: rubrerythrin family protein [Candidatus Aenigmarchaeota archaeon]|nr:rubrerythrin family protein [Candidatus Aenigmarchaeota archaeon]